MDVHFNVKKDIQNFLILKEFKLIILINIMFVHSKYKG